MSGGRLAWAVAWRLLVLGVLVGGLLVASLIWSTDAGQKYFEISDANTRVELQEDASLLVTETLRFDYHGGTFTGAYRDINTNAGARITQVSVLEGDRAYEAGGNTTLGSFDRPFRFGTVQLPRGEGTRVVWHYPQTDDSRTFRLVYEVQGAVTAYDDVIDVGWTVWGDQWDFWLDELSAEILTPDGSDPTEAWVSSFKVPQQESFAIDTPEEPAGTRSLGATPQIGDGEARFTTQRAEQGEAVVFRALVPRAAVDTVGGARVGRGDGAAKVTAEEDAITDAETLWMKGKNLVWDNALPVFGLWTLLCVLASLGLAYLARERPTSVDRYVPEPPEDLPPALAYALATEGEFDDRVVLATLLSLIDRGYYASKPTQTDDLDLEIAKPERRPPLDALESYEREALSFFDELIEGDSVAISKLKDRIPRHSDRWRKKWNELRSALDQADEGHIDWDRDLRGWRLALAIVFVAVTLLLGSMYVARSALVVVPAVALASGLLFIYLLPRTMYRRLDPAARERHARWASFKRWTEDFPRLEDDPPATLKLWRGILVHAVAFGTAERVAKSGRIPAPVASAAAGDSTAAWTYIALSGSSWNSSFDSFSSGFSSQVAPESSSSGGGGGFSGGGGGFSGGGGGGAW